MLHFPGVYKDISLTANLEHNPGPARTWRTTTSVFETPSLLIFAEPLLHMSHIFTTNQDKSNALMEDHAAVNRLHFNKEERNRTRQLKPTTAGESCCVALRKDIPPTFLKVLGPRTRQQLLDILNLSFSKGNSTQIWTIASILPLKKALKPPGCMSSYRTV